MKPFIDHTLFAVKAMLVLLICNFYTNQSFAQPSNNQCTGAIALTAGVGCATNYTLRSATASVALTGCGNASSADVWFSYIATSRYPSITLTNVGTNLATAIPYIQLYSAPSCTAGVFTGTSIACISGNTLQVDTLVAGAGLTIGATYFIRIYSGSAGPFTAANPGWQFRICITDNGITAPALEYGKSYVNITKGITGGTVEPGDILELHTTVLVSTNTAYNVSVTGSVPTNTTYVANSLRILTNEGQLYKQWTDGADGDPGTISGTTITINLGKGARQTTGGTVKSSYRPALLNAAFLALVSYRVSVNAVSYGTIINNLTAGTLSYSNSSGVVTNVSFPAVNAEVYRNYSICTNTVGANGLSSEFSGTFGTGNLKNRVASTKVPLNYTYVPLSGNDPGDNFYGVSNNTSSGGVNYSINPSDPLAANHIFNVWDIIGDHTGAVVATAGNPPADTTGGKTGGYMVVVNAAFRTDTAFLDTVKNLCPNTYYEYSAWFRNICKKCSGDSTGKSPATVGYIPTGPGDSSGVHPNLTFNINGNDYYTTGDILYTGQWIKKGFTYFTGPAQTQMIISIRNNAPGGGGNDWAIDDIGVATCTPNLTLTPSSSSINICYGDGTSLGATVKSFFNNYTQYIWERSINNGVSWTSTGFSGTGSPVFNGTDYTYTAVGPSFIGDSSQHNNIYRLRVASTAANLADPNCSFSGTKRILIYVSNCMYLLKTDITSFGGLLKNNFSTLQWQTVNETASTNYEIEKSADGIHFTVIGNIRSNAINGTGTYTYNDAEALSSAMYYRIKVLEGTGFKYTKVILLSPGKLPFAINNLVNPFSNELQFTVILPGQGDIKTTLFDNYGKVVKTFTQQQATRGINIIKIANLNGLSNGIYTLKAFWQQEAISKQVIKISN